MILRYTIWRAVQLLPVLLVVSIVAFTLVAMVPGDAADALIANGQGYYNPAAIEQMRQEFGLDQPLYIRYGRWFQQVLQGDLGRSLRSNVPVTEAIIDRLGVTVILAAGGLVFALVMGVVLGLWAAVNQGRWLDSVITIVSSIGISVPNFVAGIFLIIIFAQELKVLPAFGYVPLRDGVWGFVSSLLLPWITVGSNLMAENTRQMRSSVLEVLGRDFVQTAKAKGLSQRRLLWKHAARNALIPVITVTGLSVGRLLGGAVITETVFNLPGLGTLAVNAFAERDFTVVQGVILIAGIATVLASLLADFAYAWIDPRLREG